MDLVVTAHRGEAQAFLREGPELTAHPKLSGLWTSPAFCVLLTGEGRENALAATSLALGHLGSKIHNVVNLGVAGALDKNLSLHSIVPVRTVYSESHGQSFSLLDPSDKVGVECISADKRVLDHDYAYRLGHFAPVVDREIWGVAKAAQLANKPLCAFKLISDYADGDTDCLELKQKAKDFSNQLWDYYRLSITSSQQEKARPQTRPFLGQLPPSLSLTQSQRSQFQQLMKSLLVKLEGPAEKILEMADLPAIAASGERPKDKGRRLLANLAQLQSPELKQREQKLQELTGPLRAKGVRVNHDPSWENPSFTFSFKAQSEEEFQQQLKAAQKFSFRSAQDLFLAL